MTDFVFCIHNHQPVGNFDFVLEDAFDRAYDPFLRAISKHPSLKLSLHTTGFLLDWMAANRPAYIELLKEMVGRGQVEIMGGGYYEPILSVIPPADRHGQIVMMSDRVEELFGSRPRGVWLAERIWEPQLAATLNRAGIEYLVLDDYHFIKAGLNGEELHGYYTTEDEGCVVKVFPGSEKLRYQIPFKPTKDVLATLKEAEGCGNSLSIYADDGEKFGVWPDTNEWVYGSGWLEGFLDKIVGSSDWLRPRTFSEIIDSTESLGRVYLPTASYMEMGEWTLPEGVAKEFAALEGRLEKEGRDSGLKRFVSGGTWRNFMSKYPESNWMHKRVLLASRAIAAAAKAGKLKGAKLAEARKRLYMAECNDAFWHGVFGGLYLPHLRTGIYDNLLRAEEISRGKAKGKAVEFIDVDADGVSEAILRCGELTLFVTPAKGGAVNEIDFLPANINLSNTFTRWREAYHEKLLSGDDEKPLARKKARPKPNDDDKEGAEISTIHADAVLGEDGERLRELLYFDKRTRSSFVDRFVPGSASLAGFIKGEVSELGDLSSGAYELEEGADGIGLKRVAELFGVPISVEKSFTPLGRASVKVDYRVERLAGGEKLEAARADFFVVELNLIVPACDGEASSYSFKAERELKDCTAELALSGEIAKPKSLSITDDMTGVRVTVDCVESGCEKLYYYPIETVSQSEQGFERIFQGSTLLFFFPIKLLKVAKAKKLLESSFSLDVQMI